MQNAKILFYKNTHFFFCFHLLNFCSANCSARSTSVKEIPYWQLYAYFNNCKRRKEKMKQLKLTFGGQSFYADLLEDKAPEICSALIKAAPFQSYWFVAKICDNEVCFRAPFV